MHAYIYIHPPTHTHLLPLQPLYITVTTLFNHHSEMQGIGKLALLARGRHALRQRQTGRCFLSTRIDERRKIEEWRGEKNTIPHMGAVIEPDQKLNMEKYKQKEYKHTHGEDAPLPSVKGMEVTALQVEVSQLAAELESLRGDMSTLPRRQEIRARLEELRK